MSDVTPLVVPQVNVNDETVLLVGWTVADGASVALGDPVCDVETTKAASELTAPAAGVLVHAAGIGSRVRVGATIGAIGASQEAAAAFLAAMAGTGPAAASGATPRAAALAAEHGLTLDAIRARGVRGTIKEADVRRVVSESAPKLSGAISRYVTADGPVPAFDAAVAATLRQSAEHLILTTVDMDCRLPAARARLQQSLAAGRMVSLLHLIIAAAGRVLPKFPRLTTIAHGGMLYRYNAVDIAFVTRTSDGRLFTPVLRGVDGKPVEEIAKASQALSMQAMRGSIKAGDLEGAAFTISQVPVPGTTRVKALPSLGQSSILGVSAERQSVQWIDGAAAAVPVVTFTLSYDHALCDGVYAAGFLAALVADLEAEQP